MSHVGGLDNVSRLAAASHFDTQARTHEDKFDSMERPASEREERFALQSASPLPEPSPLGEVGAGEADADASGQQQQGQGQQGQGQGQGRGRGWGQGQGRGTGGGAAGGVGGGSGFVPLGAQGRVRRVRLRGVALAQAQA